MLKVFKDKDVQKRLLFTLFVLFMYRVGSFIPVPGVDTAGLSFVEENGLLNLMNAFSGGSLGRMSIFALGVSPYITASILVQLLQMDLIPSFTQWAEQGETGRMKLNQWTGYIAIVLGLVQGFGTAASFNQFSLTDYVVLPTYSSYFFVGLILTAGSMFLVWLGEQITRNGLGNGLSLLILAGIVSQLPAEIENYVTQNLLGVGEFFWTNLAWFGGTLALLMIAMAFVVFMERAQYRVPIHYAIQNAQPGYLPLKVNSAGVIPVIFATSLISLPQMLLALTGGGEFEPQTMQFLVSLFTLDNWWSIGLYALLLILFTFFYSLIQVDPEKTAESLARQNAYIEGVRPGEPTERFLYSVINRLSMVGAPYLGLIALTPLVLGNLFGVSMTISLAGTSLLIVVGVAMDTASQLQSRLQADEYEHIFDADLSV